LLISVVDDDESVRGSLVLLLRSRGFTSQGYASGDEFLASAQGRASDCLVLDVRLKGMSGLDLQRRLCDDGLDLPIVFISAHRDGASIRRAFAAGARGFLAKPFSEEALLGSIREALDAGPRRPPAPGAPGQR
jgi:FixJ family two-component response regulator